ncbi:MAG: zinc-binding dehydrogenase [Thermodesulfobacteriota bacterium]
MKAAIYNEVGSVEVLKYEDVPEPEISPDEVLVRVKASSLNRLDLRLRSGKSPRPVDLPHVGGVDIAGDVEKVGRNVKGVKQGTRVVVSPTVKTISHKTGGADLALNKVIGVNYWGGFAELVKVPAENLVEIPEGLSYDEASTLPVCYVTAWYGLFDRGGLKPSETVLVHAAGSGTGSAAVQVAKLAGAYVIATAGSDEKLAKARKLGADETINYSTCEFADEVKRITDKRGVDLIFDQIGGSAWEGNISSLAPKGRLLLVGVVGGGAASANIGPIIIRDISVLGVTVFNAELSTLATVAGLAVKGELKPAIDRAMPLSEVQAAQKLLEDRAQFGKVVLNP